eukprot:755726-Hanusia_phi.AAC.2
MMISSFDLPRQGLSLLAQPQPPGAFQVFQVPTKDFRTSEVQCYPGLLNLPYMISTVTSYRRSAGQAPASPA